eukprot:TRINITY_DN3499_c4_g2_i1.p1 TRINITY_DN3499_c4_g2~~TRINITY_DN3499_c4_g2_i1.p1  ORF type:complete len:360 (+),score=89.55 TRINITY_DN3499_c4_g2_i1:83-1081(+)
MERYSFLHKCLFGGVATVIAAGVTWRYCARRRAQAAAGGGPAESQTAAPEGKDSSPPSPDARGQRRVAGPCPRTRPPAAEAAAGAADVAPLTPLQEREGASADRREPGQVAAALPAPAPAPRRQLLRLQHVAQAGGDFQQHNLYAFHQMEMLLTSSQPAAQAQDPLERCVDPAEYCKQEQQGEGGGRGMNGLACTACGRIVASPLNLLWLGGNLRQGSGQPMPLAADPVPVPDAIIEVVHGAVASGAGDVRCPGCGSAIGSIRYCRSAVAVANWREPMSGEWQLAAGALAAGAPEHLLPQWCAALDRGRTRLAVVVPRGNGRANGYDGTDPA